jgi:hypothetical protein
MRVENYAMESLGGRRRIRATVRWEDVDRQDYELYYEVDQEHADLLTLSAHPFLVGSIVQALHFGEKRIRVEGDVCPELIENLEDAWRLLVHWYAPREGREFKIEEGGISAMPSHGGRASGIFFSGGIDSFAALRMNRLLFPAGHPRSFTEGILIFGLEQDNPEHFEIVRQTLDDAARETGLRLIPVYTNVYLPFREEDRTNGFSLWKKKLGGSALASVGHALAGGLSGVTVAATHAHLQPWGSHPVLDRLYSSSGMAIRHSSFTLSRPERIKVVAQWEPALRNLRVCNRFLDYAPGHLNCGACEKCLRTMLVLLSFGALEQTSAFPTKDVTAEMVDKGVTRLPELMIPDYYAILPMLEAIGRTDLVEAVERKLAEAGHVGIRKRVKDLASCLSLAASART